MSRSSDRAVTEPLVALVAVFAVSVGLALYAGVVDDTVGATGEPNRAAATADAVESDVSTVGVVEPDEVNGSTDVAPPGYGLNVTVVARDRWSAGPAPAADADTVTRRVSVRVAPGRVESGRLRVSVWP